MTMIFKVVLKKLKINKNNNNNNNNNIKINSKNCLKLCMHDLKQSYINKIDTNLRLSTIQEHGLVSVTELSYR